MGAYVLRYVGAPRRGAPPVSRLSRACLLGLVVILAAEANVAFKRRAAPLSHLRHL
jgi:hypothetical protein